MPSAETPHDSGSSSDEPVTPPLDERTRRKAARARTRRPTWRRGQVDLLRERICHDFGEEEAARWEWALLLALKQSRWDLDRATDCLKWKITPFFRLTPVSGMTTLPERHTLERATTLYPLGA